MNFDPKLYFHWYNPLAGLSRLLLNPEIRRSMITDLDNIPPGEHEKGHFLCGKIAQYVKTIVPKRPGARVIPLLMGWWSDATSVSRGSNISHNTLPCKSYMFVLS